MKLPKYCRNATLAGNNVTEVGSLKDRSKQTAKLMLAQNLLQSNDEYKNLNMKKADTKIAGSEEGMQPAPPGGRGHTLSLRKVAIRVKF